MVQAVAYSPSEEKMLDSEQEPEIDGVDPWKAAMQGDLDALLQYIDDNGDVNQRDRDNNTPLHWACQESHFDIVGVLMSRNAAVDPVNDLQSTPLHYACREGNLDIVTGLINFNANLEARNKDNLSPLHVAAGMGHIEVTKRLLDNGAHMEAEDNALYTPLWRAAYYGHPEVVEVLLKKGANRLALNKKGRKPGDVFSPTVEDDKKDRIKVMLGMARLTAASTGATTAVASSGGARSGSAGGGLGVAGAKARGSGASGVGNGGMVGSAYRVEPVRTDTSSGVQVPLYNPTAQQDPAPSAASLADSAYQYPDPSPANSPSSSIMLNSTATVMSEAVIAAAVRDGASVADKLSNSHDPGNSGNGNIGGVGRGGLAGSVALGAISVGAGGDGSAGTSSAAAGVQTTPSVNGVAEMNRLKSELSQKNQELQQMGVKVEEFKDKMLQAQANNTRELDDADVQAEMLSQKISQAEKDLEAKKREVGEAKKEVEESTRRSEERITQLEQDLRIARNKTNGSCSCTVS